MEIYRGLDLPAEFQGGIVSIGNFDGLHLGHREMLRRLSQLAQRQQVASTLVTFDPPPLAILAPDRLPPRLTRIERKLQLIEEYGIDQVVIIPATSSLLQLTARQFFDEIIVQTLHAKGMVEGENFCFGKQRGGTIDVLKQFCDQAGYTLEVVSPVEYDGTMVSSTRIRQLLDQGDLQQANECLVKPFQLTGEVIHGAARGRELGTPTANMGHIQTILPAHGVYAGKAEIEGKAYPVALNIGPNPTFGEQQTKVEAHVLDFAGNLYDQLLSVDLLKRIRDLQEFETSSQLQQQIQEDLAVVQQTFAEN